VLSRAHPSRLSFDVVCLTIDGAWVASVRDDDCTWRAVPRGDRVVIDFDPCWFETCCVHAAWNIYWHIWDSSRLLQLDPRTLEFSFMLVHAALGDKHNKYHIEEMLEDGRLCMAAIMDKKDMQI
jgi:hypothetical protein